MVRAILGVTSTINDKSDDYTSASDSPQSSTICVGLYVSPSLSWKSILLLIIHEEQRRYHSHEWKHSRWGRQRTEPLSIGSDTMERSAISHIINSFHYTDAGTAPPGYQIPSFIHAMLTDTSLPLPLFSSYTPRSPPVLPSAPAQP